MKIAAISFTKNGIKLEEKIVEKLKINNYETEGYFLSKKNLSEALLPIDTNLSDWTFEQFKSKDAIIFIGATGIAVRAIAPFVKSKDEDPAIICIDELGNYVISLLSGHLGWANDLSLAIADIIKATPIISTATDLNKKFAVDTWAKSQALVPVNISAIKAVSSNILNDEDVLMYSDYKISGKLPENIKLIEKDVFIESINSQKVGIYLSDNFFTNSVYDNCLWLTPKNLHLGIGARRGIAKEQIEALFFQVMGQIGAETLRVSDINSIDIKADELAICQFSEGLAVNFHTYTAEELLSLKGEFTASTFVKSKVGVDNVCERAALLASHGGELVVRKTSLNGVTMAIAKSEVNLSF